MRIEIDNEGASYRAKLTIDGKTVSVGVKYDGAIEVEDIPPHEHETLGAMIAVSLAEIIIRILQAEAFACEAQGLDDGDVHTFTWDRLNRGALLVAREKLKL